KGVCDSGPDLKADLAAAAADRVAARLDTPGPPNWVRPNGTIDLDRPSWPTIVIVDYEVRLPILRRRPTAPQIAVSTCHEDNHDYCATSGIGFRSAFQLDMTLVRYLLDRFDNLDLLLQQAVYHFAERYALLSRSFR